MLMGVSSIWRAEMISHVIHPSHGEYVRLVWLYHMLAQVFQASIKRPEMAMQAKRNSHQTFSYI
jgi:hypothetical protein